MNCLEEKLQEFRDGKMNIVNLLDNLSKVYKDYSREYELFIVSLISLDNVSKDEFKYIIDNEKLDDNIRYAAFFALCTIYRRNKEYSYYKSLINRYSRIFNKFKSFLHLKSMYLIEVVETKEDMERVIKLSKELISNTSPNAGFLHSFAINVVRGFEDGFFNKDIDNKLLDEAIEAINEALELQNEYAKFHSTKGRLKCILGEYDSARKELKKAIDLEDSSKEGYSLRISDYQIYLMNVTYKENIEKIHKAFKDYEKKIKTLEEKLKDTSNELENTKSKNLEFLGFFTALISFTIGSIQILNNQNFVDAIRLILTLCGGLLLVFGGFGIVLNGKKYIIRNIVVWGLGTMIIFIALFKTVI